MQNAAAASLSRFDTGYWSYYALPREPSPPDYHRYVVQLLTKLKTADPRFADAATRFAAYEKEPPAFQLANGGVGQVRFWLSKPATVVADHARPGRRSGSRSSAAGTRSRGSRSAPASIPCTSPRPTGTGTPFAIDAPPIVRVGPGPFNAGEAVDGRRAGHAAARRREPRVAHLAGRRDRARPGGRRAA